MDYSYCTIKEFGTDEITEKRSRFIGYVKPVSNEEEAQSFVAEIKSKHYDAKHNIFAYIIREPHVCRYSDDGEPQSTAGLPVLKMLENRGLTDIAVVVTRYFGGILLGTGGLVRAYTDAASAALEKTPLRQMKLYAKVSVKCDYSFYGVLTPMIYAHDGRVDDTLYEDAITVNFFLPTENVDAFKASLTDSSRGTLTATVGDSVFLEN